ncbi:amidohydrolase [Streptomyces sp. NPDC048659]|uniref:amidohydrolase n=1 Tax=Streptomyces sp. NPDC048659 TaxID=3155489 RepID=UPI00343AB4DE
MSAEHTAPDLLLVGARLRTPALSRHTAVAVRDGLITAVGDDTDARAWRGPRTEVVDLGGATLTPGLTDAHSHPVWGLEMAEGTDLSAVTDLDGLRAALRAAERREGWIVGFGLDHNVFAGRPIHHELIEEAIAGAPAFLRLYDGHSALASAAALRAAGIDGPRAFDQRSEIVCDPAGRPTGHLNEHAAMELMDPVLPARPFAERRDRLVELLGAMAATGLTGAHVMDLGGPDVPGLLAAVEEAGELPVRLRLAPWCMPGATAEELDELVRLQDRAGRRWRIGGVKFFMDGTVEGGTAWLEHADCHGQGTDAFWPDPAAYAAAVRHLHRAGVGTATHAIGDAAVRHVLDTVESLGSAPGPRHRVEHIETVPDSQLPRFAALGVVASMQPPHTAYTRADHTDEWSKRLGEERADRAWRCRDLRDAGAHLALGSDWPIAHYDARQVLATAQAPRGAAAARPGLTGLMALEGMTTHAAFAAGEEHLTGRVAPGHRADLTAFALDPTEAPADETAEAPVRLTVTGGRISFRAEA